MEKNMTTSGGRGGGRNQENTSMKKSSSYLQQNFLQSPEKTDEVKKNSTNMMLKKGQLILVQKNRVYVVQWNVYFYLNPDQKSGCLSYLIAIIRKETSDMTNTLFLVRRQIEIDLPLHDVNPGYFGPLLIVLSVDLFLSITVYSNSFLG